LRQSHHITEQLLVEMTGAAQIRMEYGVKAKNVFDLDAATRAT
jgi:hypothetical protein